MQEQQKHPQNETHTQIIPPSIPSSDQPPIQSHQSPQSSTPTQLTELTPKQKYKDKLKQAYEHFHKNQYPQAQQIYTNIIQQSSQSSSKQAELGQSDLSHNLLQFKLQALKNRASLYLSSKRQNLAVLDCQLYLKIIQQTKITNTTNLKNIPPPQLYTLYITSLIKTNQIPKSQQTSKTALQHYPYHKKLAQLSKLSKQKNITSEQQVYVQHIYEKLCSHPKIRQYLKQQSFLTKVERLIRNPSLAGALEKMDGRVREVADFIMMADQEF